MKDSISNPASVKIRACIGGGLITNDQIAFVFNALLSGAFTADQLTDFVRDKYKQDTNLIPDGDDGPDDVTFVRELMSKGNRPSWEQRVFCFARGGGTDLNKVPDHIEAAYREACRYIDVNKLEPLPMSKWTERKVHLRNLADPPPKR